jgi:hypothetical protein
MKLCLTFASFAIVLLLGAPAGLFLQEAPDSAPILTVAFVGNDNVDLMWNHVSPLGYQVKRDGIVLSAGSIETINGEKFYRDTTAVKSIRYTYQVCALTSGDPECSLLIPVDVGDVEGHLYKNLTWASGTYDLVGEVMVEMDITLNITGGTIRSGTGTKTILADPGKVVIAGSSGNLVVIQNINLEIYTAGSSISYCDGWTFLSVDSYVGLSITHSKIESLKLHAGASTITDNELVGQVSLSDNASATISDNIMVASVKLRNSSSATITHNDAIGEIDMGGKDVTISYNKFQGSGVLVWPKSGSTATIEKNTFKFGTPLYGGVDAGSIDPPPVTSASTVNFIDNLVTNGEGLYLGPEIHFQIVGNTIVFNHIGILGNNAFGTIQNNCIAGNTSAGVSWLGNIVDANQNWWGHELGPSLKPSDNRGDLIVVNEEGGVQSYNFLSNENCDDTVRNLKIAKIEVTQAIQNSSNSIRFVAGMETIVRVYLASSPRQVPNVDAKLTVLKDGQPLGVIPSIQPATTNPMTYLQPDGTFTFQESLRGLGYSSLYFKIHKAWQQGTVTLIAEVNPSHTIKEKDYEDNFADLEVTFEAGAPDLKVGVMPVNYSGGSGPEGGQAATGMVSPQTLLDSLKLIQKIYPGNPVEPALLPAINWAHNPYSYIGSHVWEHRLLNQLRVRYLLQAALDPLEAPTQLQAIFPAGVFPNGRSEPGNRGGLGKVGYVTPGQVKVGWNILQNLGVPWPPSCPVQINEYGYDIQAGEVITPGTFEITCGESQNYPSPPYRYWIGPTTYQNLMALPALPAAPQAPTPAATYAIVSAFTYIDSYFHTTKVQFDPVWQVTAGSPPANPPAGTQYCLELRDAAEAVLSSYCFNLYYLESYHEDSFTVSLPVVGTPAKLALRSGGTLSPDQPNAEIGSLPVSAHAPQVTLTTPNGGESLGASVAVQWSGSDADPGTQLTYNLLYSGDVTTWMPVATGITLTQYTLDLGLIPGSTSARLRVMASDGYYTASDDSNGSFTVSNKAPLVSIISPTGFTVVPSGAINLSGTAYDADDGVLAGVSLVWSSNRDGLLGTGANLVAVSLSPGTHMITLTATDSAAQAASAAVPVFSGAVNLLYLPTVRK